MKPLSPVSGTIWSGRIQSIACLDASRETRFREDRRDLILYVLGLSPGMAVLDAGCGPGALTRKIARWLGQASRVTGVDADAAFIEYASRRAEEQHLSNVTFVLGDVLALPLQDKSVDACISHTVIEHVPNREFLCEQKRVCRPGGRVSVMGVHGKIATNPDLAPRMGEREEDLMKPIVEALEREQKARRVGAYSPDPAVLPRVFQELGFQDVQVDALALPTVPDDSRVGERERRAMIESFRREALDFLEMGQSLPPGPLSPDRFRELRDLVSARFDARLALADRGACVWDYEIPTVLVVSGTA